MACCIENTLHLWQCCIVVRSLAVICWLCFTGHECLTDASCNDTFQLDSKCYKVHKTERVNWFTAVNRCRSNNASLAVFDDDVRQYFPSSLLSDDDRAWIGLMKSWWTWPGLLLLVLLLLLLLLLLLSTNATLVCVLSDIKSAVILCRLCIFQSVRTDISATVSPIGVKFCMMAYIGPGHQVSFFGGGTTRRTPKSEILGLNFGHLTAI